MKNLLRAFVLLLLATAFTTGTTVGGVALAQGAQAKRVVKIDESTGELVDVTATVAPATQDAAKATVHEQAASVIEDSPLNMSAAERRRRERQNLEMQTEQKIVEKLEDARMDDERTRSERLFNKGFSSRDRQEKQEVQAIEAAPAAPVAAAVVVAPAPVIAVKEEPKVDIRSEVRAALDEMNTKEEAPSTSYYMSGLVGVADYPNAKNIRGGMALGFAVGLVTAERFVAEGTFQYSQYDIGAGTVTTVPYKEMSQYNFQAAAKYQLLSGRVRPVVGALVSYTYRSYANRQTYTGYPGATNVVTSNDSSTNAFDIGGLIGLDVQITSNFSVGADLRYMGNIAYRGNVSGTTYTGVPTATAPVEEFGYYMSSVSGKFTF